MFCAQHRCTLGTCLCMWAWQSPYICSVCSPLVSVVCIFRWIFIVCDQSNRYRALIILGSDVSNIFSFGTWEEYPNSIHIIGNCRFDFERWKRKPNTKYIRQLNKYWFGIGIRKMTALLSYINDDNISGRKKNQLKLIEPIVLVSIRYMYCRCVNVSVRGVSSSRQSKNTLIYQLIALGPRWTQYDAIIIHCWRHTNFIYLIFIFFDFFRFPTQLRSI